jgi:hypothetical protein
MAGVRSRHGACGNLRRLFLFSHRFQETLLDTVQQLGIGHVDYFVDYAIHALGEFQRV